MLVAGSGVPEFSEGGFDGKKWPWMTITSGLVFGEMAPIKQDFSRTQIQYKGSSLGVF
jgi:hypothetical protein